MRREPDDPGSFWTRLSCLLGWHGLLFPYDGAGRTARYRCRRCLRDVPWP